MKKAVIVSDSHGLKRELELIKEKHKDGDLFIHCGDSELEESDPAIAGFHTVKGNCDYYGDFPDEIVHELGGWRFFVTHGHLFSVKRSLMALLYRAHETESQIICFGHSHMLGAEVVHNKLFINPGSIRQPRGRRERTYVVLHLDGDQIDFRVFDLEKGELLDLRQSFSLPFNS